MKNRLKLAALLLALTLAAGCASTGQLIDAPNVSLRNVEIADLDFSGQTFLLGFDVTNPNSFPLPIKSVAYGVELGGYRFASGTTSSDFTVPASGDAEFSISVQVDLLKTAPQLLYIVRDSLKRDIPYELKGQLGLNIPLTDPVRFSSSGEIRLQAVSRQALKMP
ncbi:MAG: LEA type 2 family protein [Woeseiaceae bacterium]|jgi:LEA14-like dessication related protein